MPRSPARAGLLMVLAASAGAACGDSPTRPSEAAPPADRLSVAPETLRAFAASVDDARLRVLPALAPEAARTAIDLALGDVSNAVASGDRAALAAAVAGAEAALRAVPRQGEEASSSAPDAEAVALVLAQARLLLDGGGEAEPR